MSIYFKQADMPIAFGSSTQGNSIRNEEQISFLMFMRTLLCVCVTLCPEKEISVDVVAFIVLNIESERVCVCVFVFI